MAECASVDRDRWPHPVWVVEDEPASAALAAELCEAAGAETSVFPAPSPFLAALHTGHAPSAVVLDWRLEREVSAALFLATRHRHPRLPIILWTASAASALPAIVRADGFSLIVDKAGGLGLFERALAWAVEVGRAGGVGG